MVDDIAPIDVDAGIAALYWQGCPALEQSWHAGRVRLHFFLNDRQRSHARPTDGVDVAAVGGCCVAGGGDEGDRPVDVESPGDNCDTCDTSADGGADGGAKRNRRIYGLISDGMVLAACCCDNGKDVKKQSRYDARSYF